MHGEAAHGQRADLALVETGVAVLRPIDQQRPFVAMPRRLETLVARVRVRAHRQDVKIPVPNPGHLPKTNMILSILFSYTLNCKTNEMGV